MSDKILPFNPLDKRNLGASVAEALLASRVHPLGEIDAFEGAGLDQSGGRFRQPRPR